MDQVFRRWFKTSWTWQRQEDGTKTLLECEGAEVGRWHDHPLVTTDVQPEDDHCMEWTAWQHGEVALRVPCAVRRMPTVGPSILWPRRSTHSHVGKSKRAGWLWMNMASSELSRRLAVFAGNHSRIRTGRLGSATAPMAMGGHHVARHRWTPGCRATLGVRLDLRCGRGVQTQGKVPFEIVAVADA